MLSRCWKSSVRCVAGACLVIGLMALAGFVDHIGSTALAASRSPFPRPSSLEPRVRFWIKTFSFYSSRDFVLHDRDDVSKVYQALHMPGSGFPDNREIANANEHLKDKYSRILYWLGEGGKPRTADERRVAAQFAGARPGEYREAARNLRVQQGLRERFMKGMLRSRRYRPMMERVFRREGVPTELVALAAVESGFNPRARSHAGAVGIWQFIRSTGRKYMRINRHRDDRLNPYRATRAAARLLQSNYQLLGSWPLAITAYNYGASGMARAADAYNGNYLRILEKYEGPHFGFAVKNYYSEFLAALQIYRHPDRYFPGLRGVETPLLLADSAAVRHDSGRHTGHYRVHRGDTLSHIARRYGVSVASLLSANGIDHPRSLHPGRLLSIPGGHLRYASGGNTQRYRVHSGDTLSHIARRYGVSVASLMSANGIDDPRSLHPGRLLSIPGGRLRYASGGNTQRYRVHGGDTLYAIAHRSGVSVRTLMEANRIDDPRSLSIGQVLHIPGV